MDFPKIGRCTEPLHDIRLDRLRCKPFYERPPVMEDVSLAECRLSCLEIYHRTPIIGIEFRTLEWPAAAGYPFAMLKIYGVKRDASSSPYCGCSAKSALPIHGGRRMNLGR